MYIAPDGNIKLLRNVPLEPSYDHTLYFASETDQKAYFGSVAGVLFTEQYYTRHYRGYLRVQINAESCYDINYLMFQNHAYGNKWFYAFVTSVNWINNEVTEFAFQLDYMQTWMFNYTLGQCFVERQHSVTDNIGENLIPEGLETGDYIYNKVDDTVMYPFQNYKIVFLCTEFCKLTPNPGGSAPFTYTWETATAEQFAGIFNGIGYGVYDTVDSAKFAIDVYTAEGKEDSILGIYMIPASFLEQDTHNDPVVHQITITKDTSWTYTWDGKSGPRNNKLYTAPYSELLLTNNEGDNNILRYEYFSTSPSYGNNIAFNLIGIACPVPQAHIIPLLYKGVAENYNERMVIDDFPMCAYATDSFRAWLAQNKYSIATQAAGIAGETIVGLANDFANPISPIQWNFGKHGKPVYNPRYGARGNEYDMGDMDIADTGITLFDSALKTSKLLSTIEEHKHVANRVHGSGANALAIATKTLGFKLYKLRPRPEFACIIDDYFDRYGYACHRNVVPNTHSRPHWNYVKTVGCTLHGSLPADAASAITAIYDNGITFWKNANEVGNYDLDNRPST